MNGFELEQQEIPERTCARCERPVGRYGRRRARPFRIEVCDNGVSVVCEHMRSCKAAAADRAKEK